MKWIKEIKETGEYMCALTDGIDDCILMVGRDYCIVDVNNTLYSTVKTRSLTK